MEPNKVQGKRSFTDKARDEEEEEEEEEDQEEIDDDVVSGGGTGFQSGGDEYMVRKKRLVMAGEGRARRSGSGSGAGGSTVRPGCQADSCPADLSEAKHYHRRHKICEDHAKAPVVLVAGLQQRFCQQCSRFHGLPEFDSTKKSCRRRLAGHNERRRKTSSELITREGSS